MDFNHRSPEFHKFKILLKKCPNFNILLFATGIHDSILNENFETFKLVPKFVTFYDVKEVP